MEDLQIVDVDKESPYLGQIESLFRDLYEYMKGVGLMMPLVPGGEKLWRVSVEKMSGGRFGRLLAAVRNGEVVGFGHGVVRYATDYLGGHKVGYISQLYVRPDRRTGGVGRILVAELEKWFREKNVHSFELQVICGNALGIGFWERLGYRHELLQMRKFEAE